MSGEPSAVEKRNSDLAKSAWGMLQEMKPAIAAVLPKHLTPERMAMIAFTAMRRTPKLMLCSRESIIGSILQAAMLGLEPSGPLGHGALIPYGQECQFQPMYQGLLELARRSGFVKDIQLRAVYKGDHYLYRFGLDPTIEHIPMEGEGADNPDREPTHVYCIIRLMSGGTQWDQMSFLQGIAHGKLYSPSFNTREYPGKFKPGSVWADNPLAMVLKTICKRTLKLCPKSPEMAAALEADDLSEIGKTTKMTMEGGVFSVDIAEPEIVDKQQIPAEAGKSAIDRIVDEKNKKASNVQGASPKDSGHESDKQAGGATQGREDVRETASGPKPEPGLPAADSASAQTSTKPEGLTERLLKRIEGAKSIEELGEIWKSSGGAPHSQREIIDGAYNAKMTQLVHRTPEIDHEARCSDEQFEILSVARLQHDIEERAWLNWIKGKETFSPPYKMVAHLKQKDFRRALNWIVAGGREESR